MNKVKGHIDKDQECLNISVENIWLVLGLSFHSAVIRWNVWGSNEARVTVRLIFLWPLRPGGRGWNYYYPDHTQLCSRDNKQETTSFIHSPPCGDFSAFLSSPCVVSLFEADFEFILSQINQTNNFVLIGNY